MTARSDLDPIVKAWFDEGSSTMPDRVIDAVADRIAGERQRLAWRFRRSPAVNILVRLAATATTLIVLVFVAYSVLPGASLAPGGQATPTPLPTVTATIAPTATPPVACDGGTAGCLGPLVAGTYTAANFRPRLTYSVPEGWANTYDPGRAYTLVPPGGGYSFQVLSEVSIPEQTQPECNAKKKAGVGNTVSDWVAFLTKNPGLTAAPPVAVTVGGFAGYRVDFARSSSWSRTCPGSVGPAVMVWVRTGVTQQGRWTDDQQESFWILDVAGSTVLITLDSSPNADDHARDLADAQPIVDSMIFTPAR